MYKVIMAVGHGYYVEIAGLWEDPAAAQAEAEKETRATGMPCKIVRIPVYSEVQKH